MTPQCGICPYLGGNWIEALPGLWGVVRDPRPWAGGPQAGPVSPQRPPPPLALT